MPPAKKAPAKKPATAKKTKTVVVKDDPVKDLGASNTPVRRPGRPPKAAAPIVKMYSMTVVTPSDRIELSYESYTEYQAAYQQIAFKCGSGRFAMVQCNGKEYTFCNVEYIVRDI
tara:strand:+ start:4247 stop:4591 length:345 start_codon:yes stop_codon:yes gene_type:complete